MFCSNVADLRRNQRIIFQKQNLIHTANQSLLSLDLRLHAEDSSLSSSIEKDQTAVGDQNPGGMSEVVTAQVPKKFFDFIQNNKSSIYFNFLLFKHETEDGRSPILSDATVTKQQLTSGSVLFGNVKMIKYDVIPRHFHHRYLLSDFGLVKQSEIAGNDLQLSYPVSHSSL